MVNLPYANRLPEQVLDALLRDTADAVLIFTQGWRLAGFNPQAQVIFQLQESVLGLSANELSLPFELLDLLPIAPLKTELTLDDERVFQASLQSISTTGNDYSDAVWLMVLRDITHYKELYRNQNEFIHIVSHDLRSPLTTIRGYVNMLQEGVAGELTIQQTTFMDRIMSGIVQLSNLVDNIQDAGRFDPETGFYEMSRAPVDIREIVQHVVANQLIPADKRHQTIEVHVDDDVPIINGDQNMLERAIVNLTDNAVKYTPDHGVISITAHRNGNQVEIAVQDSGIGIRPEDRERLFQKHSRIVREETKKTKGSGLGLFIVKSVAQRHNGSVRVESEDKQGSRFILTIPLEGENLVI